ncbi:MAG: (2Fe-2S)-binding protein [Steroidobacteraceae bacterium]
MGFRIHSGTVRPPGFTVTFDGARISAHAGETIAAVLLANHITCFRRDTHGEPRGPYCNMGTCFECLVEVKTRQDSPPGDGSDEQWLRVRACLTAVSIGIEIRTAASAKFLGREI